MKLEFGGVTYVVRHEIKVTGNFLPLLMSVTHSHCTGLVFHLAISDIQVVVPFLLYDLDKDQ